MATIPKKLAFKLYFRKKTKTRKLIYRERKLRQLGQNTNAVFLRSLNSVTTSKLLDLVPIKKPLPLKQCNLNPWCKLSRITRAIKWRFLLKTKTKCLAGLPQSCVFKNANELFSK
jgi:hypothetical protein